MANKKKKKKKLPSTAAEFRSSVIKKLKTTTKTNKKGKEVKVYKAASKSVKSKSKDYKTKSKYNKYYQMTNCNVLKKMDGTPENDMEVYNKLLENDKEVDTMIADLKKLTKDGDQNLATIKAGINNLMKNELNEVSFNVGGTAPLYEMIYHINENLNNHIKKSSFTAFQKDFISAAKKHAKIEMDYFQEYTRQVYKTMGSKLQTAEKKYNDYAKVHKTNSDVSQNGFKIPEDGHWYERFTLVSGKEVDVKQRNSYTIIKENEYGEKVYKRNIKKKKYSPVRKKAKQLTGNIK